MKSQLMNLLHANNYTKTHEETFTGESLASDKTVNADIPLIRIKGKTIEVGVGTKSPDNPYTFNSTSNFDLLNRSRNMFDKSKVVNNTALVWSNGNTYIRSK